MQDGQDSLWIGLIQSILFILLNNLFYETFMSSFLGLLHTCDRVGTIFPLTVLSLGH